MRSNTPSRIGVWRVAALGVLLAAAATSPVEATDSVEFIDLFTIHNSSSRNYVQYQVRVDSQCRIVAEDPIRVFWHKVAWGPGQTAELKWVERTFAYGIEVRGQAGQALEFRIAADDSRAVLVQAVERDGICTAAAGVRIDASVVQADRAFVEVRPRRLAWPEVRYVDLFGIAAGGQQVCGRVFGVGEPSVPCPPTALGAADQSSQRSKNSTR